MIATTHTAVEVPAIRTFSADAISAICGTSPQDAVGELSPEELDAHICSLGRLMAKAHAEGDRAGAVEMQRLMYQAIRARTPGHQAAMERAIYQRMQDACYFSSDEAHEPVRGAA